MPYFNKGTSFFLRKFIYTVEEFELIERGDLILAAVSGGVDSVSLLYSLYFLRHILGIKIACAVFDHEIRESSYKEVEYLKDLCNILSIRFYTDKANILAESKINKKSIEETARNFRYTFLYKTADKIHADKIATAHHLDDFAENFLMRAITGGGSGSIAGIKVKNGIIIRPFIKFSKNEIIDFACLNSIKFFEDYTNYQENIFRNNIRLNIIPEFKKINPSFLGTLYRTSEVLRKDDEFIENYAKEIFKNTILNTEYKDSGILTFNIVHLLKLPEAVLYRVFKITVNEILIGMGSINNNSRNSYDNIANNENFISYGNFKNLLNIIKSSKPNISFNLNKNIRVIRSYEKIIFEKIENNKYIRKIRDINYYLPLNYKHYEYLINYSDIIKNNAYNIKTINKSVIHIKEIDVDFTIGKLNGVNTKIIINKLIKKEIKKHSANAILFDFDKLSFPVKIRNFINGDRFIPLGMEHEKKVKDFFIDKKIPELYRQNLPLILFGGQIVWIGFIMMSDTIKISEFTKNIGYIKLLNNNE
ncbi:MAG: tRNA lysidine(34) synthetase TilS [Deltaproteobacteria bacterium]|uniref:tRNA(Ile)-lysidine synthase n=1 Tax=Acididesulfobacter guangdongensis TaxID=2597225 RepID=A0A519BFQ5_ACIG2|nr:tRNA lysidine(34) synthetase TilS [Deltaproteobacteria bacterium]RZD16102.1 MAG: tRNA lysidine(34) synthetase TilS [Candidatus Acididesulfobacter guangdongensis]